MHKLLLIITIFITFFVFSVNSVVHRESKAKKGKFFVHTLHSASLFNRTVPVKWTATLKGRPALPQWLHLVNSRHEALAYLIGTPVTTAKHVTVHVIAKSSENFKSEQMYVTLSFIEDEGYTESTLQILDINIKNFDAETILTDRTGLIGRLEKAASDTFRGKNVKPYIFNIRSEISPEKEHLFRYQKTGTDLLVRISNASTKRVSISRMNGSIVSIGTQRGFYPAVFGLVDGIRSNTVPCRKNNQVALNKHFAPTFMVDWCQTRLLNLTQMNELPAQYYEMPEDSKDAIETSKTLQSENSVPDQPPREVSPTEGGISIWQTVFLFATIVAVLFVLAFILSCIFFGNREGQQWRDYKTPRGQLEEFVSVRESQRHLRELSVQRQLLLMSDRDASVAPSGIHSFLQPKSRPMTSMSGSTRFSKSASRLNENVSGEEVVEMLPTNENIPVGKQTVAEAAKQCGSSLHLYRNPLESETEEEQESDSLEAKETLDGF